MLNENCHCSWRRARKCIDSQLIEGDYLTAPHYTCSLSACPLSPCSYTLRSVHVAFVFRSHLCNLRITVYVIVPSSVVVYAVCFFFSLAGHDRYYNKYINVKKGGIGGVAMLLVGYVALSYLWEYDHISKKCIHSRTSCLGCSTFLEKCTKTHVILNLFSIFSSRTWSLEEVPLSETIRPSGVEPLCSPCSFYSAVCWICDCCDQ